jgi:hypothetical protein
MDPVSIGLTIAGTGLNVFGALSEGKSKSSMYNYQAGVAELNARIAKQNRDYALSKGEFEAGRYGLKARQTFGAIRTGQAASGFRLDSGSNKDVAESAHELAKIDLATIRSNAAREAYGYEVEAASQQNQASLYKMAAADAKKGSAFKAVASLISGATSVASKWTQGTTAGLFQTSTSYNNPTKYGTLY